MKIEILKMLEYAVLGTLVFLAIALPIVFGVELWKLRRRTHQNPQPADNDRDGTTGARSAYERDEAWRRLQQELKPKAPSK